MFWKPDFNDMYDPDKKLEILLLDYGLPKWFYTTSEWSRFIVERLRLESIIKEHLR